MNGFVVLYKEENMTSSFAAGLLRGIYREKRSGHTGTLDPMAVGVLPVALGRATRFIPFLPDTQKGYVARLRFGMTTDTLDSTGKILSQCEAHVTAEEVEALLPRFRGAQRQLPPMYSAISKDGVRLYELARRGLEIAREERAIRIDALALSGVYGDEFELTVSCSPGTYIRSLVADIGAAQGTGAVMTALCRTRSNGFAIEQAHTLQQLRELRETAVIPVETALQQHPAVTVSAAQAVRFCNGGALDAVRVQGLRDRSLYRVFSPDNHFLGLGVLSDDRSQLLVKKVFGND